MPERCVLTLNKTINLKMKDRHRQSGFPWRSLFVESGRTWCSKETTDDGGLSMVVGWTMQVDDNGGCCRWRVGDGKRQASQIDSDRISYSCKSVTKRWKWFYYSSSLDWSIKSVRSVRDHKYSSHFDWWSSYVWSCEFGQCICRDQGIQSSSCFDFALKMRFMIINASIFADNRPRSNYIVFALFFFCWSFFLFVSQLIVCCQSAFFNHLFIHPRLNSDLFNHKIWCLDLTKSCLLPWCNFSFAFEGLRNFLINKFINQLMI